MIFVKKSYANYIFFKKNSKKSTRFFGGTGPLNNRFSTRINTIERFYQNSFFKKKFQKFMNLHSLHVHVCYTVRLNKLDRLVAVVPVEASHSLENQNIFLNAITADSQP